MDGNDQPSVCVEVPCNSSSPDVIVQALRDEVQKEWSRFRQSLDEAASQHFRCQEELFARCVEKLTSADQATAAASRAMERPNSDSTRSTETWCEDATTYQWTGNKGELLQTALEPVKTTLKRMEGLLLQLRTECKPRSFVFTSPTHSPSKEAIKELLRSNTSMSLGDKSQKSGSLGHVVDDSNPMTRRSSTFEDLVAASKAWNTEQKSAFTRRVVDRFSGMFDWWQRLEEPERTGRLVRIVKSKPFETTTASVIIINAAFSWYAMNQEMVTLRETGTAEPSTFVTTAEYCFLSFYTIELIMKLTVHRWYFFCNEAMSWNIFDAVLVVFSLFDAIMTASMPADGEEGGTDLTFMRTLRIMRVARVLRGLRVMKFFSELRLMLKSLIGSLSSLFWSIMMMCLIFYIFSLVFVQGTATWMLTNEPAEAEYPELFSDFGSVESAVLSLFMACTGGDDWRVFLQTLGPIGAEYGALFVMFIAFSHIALMNILTAIFVQRAMKLAEPDREQQAMEQRHVQIAEYEELRSILNEIDANNSGSLNVEEFCEHIKRGKLGARMSVLGLDIRDAQLFFQLVCTGFEGDEIGIEEFVDRCMRMRGQASSIEMQYISHSMGQMQKSQKELQRYCTDGFHRLGKRVETLSSPGGQSEAEVDPQARSAKPSRPGSRQSTAEQLGQIDAHKMERTTRIAGDGIDDEAEAVVGI